MSQPPPAPTQEKAPVTVALVEDEPAIRERLGGAIARAPALRLVHTSATANEALRWLSDHRADVLLVDLGLPDRSGVDVIAACRRRHPDCQVMVVTMFADEQHMLSAFEAGAAGYLLKDGSEADLAEHVQQLHAGGSPLSPLIARQLLRRWQPPPPATGPAAPGPGAVPVPQPVAGGPLTTREREVLDLVSRGFTYIEVAERIGVAVSTIRTHVRGVYTKLDAHNKTEAVFEARQLGLLR